MNQVIQYLEQLKQVSPDTYYYSKPYLVADLVEILKRNKYKYVYLKDSVFVYDVKNRDGYVVRGNPYYWLEHPDGYPEDLHDYWSYFNSACFDEMCNHMYEFDDYSFAIQTGKNYDAICKLDRVGDMYTFSISAGSHQYYIPSYDTLLVKKINRIRDTISAFMNNNPNVYSCIIPVQLSRIGTLWSPKDMKHHCSRDSLSLNENRMVIATDLFEGGHCMSVDSSKLGTRYYRYALKESDNRKKKACFMVAEGRQQVSNLIVSSECLDNRIINGLEFKCYRYNDMIYGYWYDTGHDVSFSCEDSLPEDIVTFMILIKQVAWI